MVRYLLYTEIVAGSNPVASTHASLVTLDIRALLAVYDGASDEEP